MPKSTLPRRSRESSITPASHHSAPAVELDLPPSGKRKSRLHFHRFHTLKSISQMPKVFWPLLHRNRKLLSDLPALGATAIEFWAKAKYGARVILMVVQQTYGGFPNFYPHLHTLVSAGGLDEFTSRWIHSLNFQNVEHKHELMLAWKLALLTALDTARKDDMLESDLSPGEIQQHLGYGRQTEMEYLREPLFI